MNDVAVRQTKFMMNKALDERGIDLSIGGGGSSYDSLSDVSGVEQMDLVAQNTGKEKCVYFGVVTSTVFYALAMVSAGAVIGYAAAAISIAIGPLVIWQRRKLTDIEAGKETTAFLEKQADEFTAQNERLKNAVKDLGNTANKLEEHQQAFDMITATQGQNIELLEKQVADNKKIVKNMQKNVRTAVMQNLLTIIIQNDTDGDFNIDEEELEPMMKQLSEVEGVTLIPRNFKKAVEEADGSINAVMEIIATLLRSDDKNPKTAIFILDDIVDSDDETDYNVITDDDASEDEFANLI